MEATQKLRELQTTLEAQLAGAHAKIEGVVREKMAVEIECEGRLKAAADEHQVCVMWCVLQ